MGVARSSSRSSGQMARNTDPANNGGAAKTEVDRRGGGSCNLTDPAQEDGSVRETSICPETQHLELGQLPPKLASHL